MTAPLRSIGLLAAVLTGCTGADKSHDPPPRGSTERQEPRLMTGFGVVGGGGPPQACSPDDEIWKTGEPCDNGDNSPQPDGCEENTSNDTCAITSGWVCSNTWGEPSSCHPIHCGDGNPDPGEECDDGDNFPGDGCDSFCDVEPGWECDSSDPLEPSVCQLICGNGTLDSGEQCDDGPLNSDVMPDRCRNDCLNHRCGDRVVDTGEVCDTGSVYVPSEPGFCDATCSGYVPLYVGPFDSSVLTPAPTGAVAIFFGEDHEPVCEPVVPNFVDYEGKWDFLESWQYLIGLQVVLTEDTVIDNPIFLGDDRFDDRRVLMMGAEYAGVGLGPYLAPAGTTVGVDVHGFDGGSVSACPCGAGGSGAWDFCSEMPIGGVEPGCCASHTTGLGADGSSAAKTRRTCSRTWCSSTPGRT